MAVTYWSAIRTLTQVSNELGLPAPATITGLTDVQSLQLLALLNSAGNELMMYYPWEQFATEWTFNVSDGVINRPVPDDWLYFTDQTQWDRTNHWPLMGPKSPQEWAWLKGSLVAMFPRMRFRVQNNFFLMFPDPVVSATTHTIAMEYISKNWVLSAGTPTDTIVLDADLLEYNPWLLVKFVKFKFYELKGLATTGVNADFMRIFNALTGKDTGAEILSLAPMRINPFIGVQSIPDGNWNGF